MAILYSESAAELNISTERRVMRYVNTGTDRIVLSRVNVGTAAKPIAGGGAYTAPVDLSGSRLSPDSSVIVTAGVRKAVLQSRPIFLLTGDTLEVFVRGLPGDTAVAVTAFLADATPVTTGSFSGVGAVAVDHNYGGPDALSYQAADGAGIDNATIYAYVAADYAAGRRGNEYVRARTTTTTHGRWRTPIYLDPAQYTLVYHKPGLFGPTPQNLTVS